MASRELIAELLGYTVKQLTAKNRQLVKTYGITIEEFFQIMEHQEWRCPVCGKPYSRKARFCVDHEHAKGLEGPVRGLLCFTCNTKVVGHLRLEKARRILRYLEEPPAILAIGREQIAKPPKRKRRPRGRRAR